MHDKQSLVAALETLLSVLHSMPEGKMDGDSDPDMDADKDTSADTDTDSDMGDPKAKMDIAMMVKKPMEGDAMPAASGEDDEDSLEKLRKRPDYMGRMGK